MTTYLGKRCSFCLPRVPFVNCRQFMYLVISLFGFEGRIWDLIVSVPDHCLSFYFPSRLLNDGSYFYIVCIGRNCKNSEKEAFCSFQQSIRFCFALWKKLLANSINGKNRTIFNMYRGIKYCVSYNGEQSSFFSSFRGVRQATIYLLYYLPYF